MELERQPLPMANKATVVNRRQLVGVEFDVAAIVIAGAVFLPKGSRSIENGFISISLICSATINLCSSLQTKIGLFKF